MQIFDQIGLSNFWMACRKSNRIFLDGNKRTTRLLMNGQLLQAGYDAITSPTRRTEEFNRTMIGFYNSQDGTTMFGLLAGCSMDTNLRYETGRQVIYMGLNGQWPGRHVRISFFNMENGAFRS